MPRRLTPSYWSELAELQDRLNRLLEQALSGVSDPDGGEQAGSAAWRPPIDIVETEAEILVFVELPGVERDDVELAVEGRRLSLSGERRLDDIERFLRLEGRYGAFGRRIDLPGEVEEEGIEARLTRGVLEVRLPKRSPTTAVRIDED